MPDGIRHIHILIVKDKRDDIIRRMIVIRPEIAGFIHENAQILHPYRLAHRKKCVIKRMAGNIPAAVDLDLSASPKQ